MIYHLSDDNHDGEVFIPRIPASRMDDEDCKHNRVCFSKTISGAFRAISFTGCESDFYVHVPYKENTKYKVPSVDQVPDVGFTSEVWVTRKVKMKCIGKIRISYDDSWSYKKPRVRFRYLEKYY